MCGLVGMAGYGIMLNDLDAMKELLIVSQLRGVDSTGLARIWTHQDPDREDIEIRKQAVDSSAFCLKHSGAKTGMFSETRWEVFLGHTRWATMGSVTSENAHPFETESLIGAHNGTLIDEEYYDWSHYPMTDSELMFKSMDKNGVIPVLDSLDSDSAFAVSVYVKNSGTVILSRNRHRGLSIAVNKDRGVIYWASESGMLDFILDRRGIDAEVYDLVPYNLYEFHLEDIQKGNLTPWSVTEMTDKTKVPSAYKKKDAYHYAGWANYEMGNQDPYPSSTKDANAPWDLNAAWVDTH